ncbi:MAG: glycosyltransferase family 2 protein [Bacteroidota bacterium]|nr:glycosyltransferase family 2 protein [Bacteroidota bacterium]MDX5428333.1 glycosyltransferase family 2 protein [Bacteroidota bacterium]MDX5447034.1 glycosyltransferase family 2 protein [Bacteroidota bacterium]MDX5506104.1 glycosyltransferase family 2 protein [Bacteroidota bacterium]
MKELSLVIAVMNEEQNIRPLMESIRNALNGVDYEIIFVDDGSTDGTIDAINEVADDRTFVLEFMRNYGQSTAMAAGIDAAEGKYIVTLDGDLQNDPADIPMMMEELKKGDWDMVAGIRANRQDGVFLRKIPSKIANFIIQRSTDVRIKDYGCTLKVFKRRIAKNLGLYGDLHRFIPVLASLQGARITQMDVRHHARQFGHSKYGINRTAKVLSDLFLILFFQRYLLKPMHLFGIVGVVLFFIGAAIDIYLLILKLGGADIWGKPLLILGAMLTLGGIQLITTGILAEILIRTYYEAQNKTTYQIRHRFTGGRKEEE